VNKRIAAGRTGGAAGARPRSWRAYRLDHGAGCRRSPA